MSVNSTADNVLNGTATLADLQLEAYYFLEGVHRIEIKDPAFDDDDLRSEVLLNLPDMLERYSNEGIAVEAQLVTASRFKCLDMNRARDRQDSLLQGYYSPEEGVECTELELTEIRDSIDSICDSEVWGFAFRDILELKLTGGYKASGPGNPFEFWGNRLGFSEGHIRRMFLEFIHRFRVVLANDLDYFEKISK